MEIFVRCLGETRCVQALEGETVAMLGQRVAGEFGFEAVELFTLGGRLEGLEGLQAGSTLFAQCPLVGGGKKKGGKKRKAYTTPKKNKHVHKNVKLRALSYYAFNKDQVERVKKLCTVSSCVNKGVFMANHFNRFTCGRCHTTLEKVGAPKEEPKKVKAVVAAKVEAAPKDEGKKKGKK